MAEPLRGTQLTARVLDVEAPVRTPALRLFHAFLCSFAQGAGDFSCQPKQRPGACCQATTLAARQGHPAAGTEPPASEAGLSASSAASEAAADDVELLKGWRTNDGVRSLPEVNGSIAVPAASRPWFAQLAAFAGVGSMISVGYMARSRSQLPPAVLFFA